MLSAGPWFILDDQPFINTRLNIKTPIKYVNVDYPNSSTTTNDDKDVIHVAFDNLNRVFGWDVQTVSDFLLNFSLLLQPVHNHRKFYVLKGETANGKSKFIDILRGSHGSSACVIQSKLTINVSAESPATLTILAISSYITIIQEATELDAAVVKTSTGGDAVNLRAIFQSFATISPISFMMAACNAFPIMKSDNAIRSRMVFFEMPFTYVDRPNETNKLMQYIDRQHPKNDIPYDLSRGYANLFYFAFKYFRNKQCNILPIITNPTSIQLLDDFMVHTNSAYAALKEANIKFVGDTDAYMSHKEMRERITSNTIVGEKNNTKKLLEVNKKIKAIETTFPQRDVILNGVAYYRGFVVIGKVPKILCRTLQSITRTNNNKQFITKDEILQLLLADNTLSLPQRSADLFNFHNIYKDTYDVKTNTYYNIKINTIIGAQLYEIAFGLYFEILSSVL